MRITEAGTVQFPMVAHAAEVGWIPLTPEAARDKRGGEEGMLFREVLNGALRKFNPWLSDDGARQIIERIEALPPTIEGNREVLAWLRGERKWTDEAEKAQKAVRLVDFEHPGANTLHVTWEWKLKPPARLKGNRADVMFVVNGVPVCIVEHKHPKDRDAVEKGVTQLRRYELETPELLGTPQLFNVTHLLDYWYGATWSVNRRGMARWKGRPEETYKFAVQAFFEPTEFLCTLQQWILFYVEDNETRKSVLRQHQRNAIGRILDRCADPAKKRGLIWHTQGSGKTFTLLTAARLILEDKERFNNATVILVVDRTELEGQLSGWVEALLGQLQQQDIAVWRAETKAKLEELLTTDKRGLILSMIHKFEGLPADASTRDNTYVFIDEAHRSVAHELGTYLMAALPRSTIIGFTGTPVARTEFGQGTFKIFGTEDDRGYLDKYSIKESIEDETTLPIRHTMAPSEMTVPKEQLDKEFLDLASAEGVTDVEELNRVLDRAVGLRTFLTADDRVEKVAKFVAEHFRAKVLPLGYKAFLVGVNREACAKYKQALDKLLPPEWSVPIYTEGANDSLERPLVAKLQVGEEREQDVRRLFKRADQDPKILIVTDKLLTGYDAPLLYCMYLDKPMRNHVLLQAIARVNRPYVDGSGVAKKVGLVVDFVGVLRELKKALQFDSEDVSGVIEDLDLLLQELLGKLEAARMGYLQSVDGSPDARLEALVFKRFLEKEPREAFFEAFKEIEGLWEIISPAPELREYLDTYKQLAQLYAATRNAYGATGAYVADLAHKTSDLVKESVTQVGLGNVLKTITFDVQTLEGLKGDPDPDEGKVINLIRGLHREKEEDPSAAPLLISITERADRVRRAMEERQITALQAMDQLALLAAEKEKVVGEARASGLSRVAFAVHLALRADVILRQKGVDSLAFARECDEALRRFPVAAKNPEEERRLRAALYKPLLRLGVQDRNRIVDIAIAVLLGHPDDIA